MEKKYYDSPQMEIVNIQIGHSLLQGSGDREMDVYSNESVNNGDALAGQFFGGDDGGEEW